MGGKEVVISLLNEFMEEYAEEDQNSVKEIIAGFQEAINEIEDFKMDNKIEGFNLLHFGLMGLPIFEHLQPQLITIALLKFFVEELDDDEIIEILQGLDVLSFHFGAQCQ